MRYFLLMIAVVTGQSVLATDKKPLFGAPINQEQFSKLTKLHCVSCHGPDKQKGRFRIDTIDLNKLDVTQAGRLSDAVDLLNDQKMPSGEKSKLSPDSRLQLVELLAKGLNEFYITRRSKGADVIRRLSRQQYIHSLQDVLGINAQIGRDLPHDAISVDGFSNNAKDLTISELHMQYYIQTARLALDHAIAPEGPMPEAHRFSYDVTQRERGKGDKARMFPFMVPSVLDSPWDSRFVKGKTYYQPAKFLARHYRLNLTVAGLAEAGSKRHGLSEIGISLPPVFQTYEAAGGKRRAPNPNIKIALREAPRKGLFRVMVRVAKADDAKVNPVLRVTYGTIVDKAGLKVDTRTMGKPVAITAKPGEFQEVEFFGELSNYPTPQKTDTVGMSTIMLWNDVYTYDRDQERPALLVDKIIFEGPLYRSWPPETHQRIFIESENKTNESVYAREVIHAFVNRAFRTDVSESTIAHFHGLWRSARDEGISFQESIRETLVAVLCSPRFLYMAEPEKAVAKASVSTSDWAIRMAYFLWDGPPDDSLRRLAKSGKLAEDKTLDAQIDRMIKDPRSWRFVESFCKEWLQMSKFYEKPHDGRLTRFIKDSMDKETYHFFADLLRNNRSFLNCLDSDYAMVNSVLANFYGIKGVEGSHFRRVTLEPGHPRGGMLTQGTFMVANAGENAQSHPIRRGVWLTERILGIDLPPPPKTVNDVSEEIEGFLDFPLKKQLKLHQENESCAACHRKIDPYGIPFESFDGNGAWRETVTRVLSYHKGRMRESKGVPVDPSTEIEGKQIADINALKSYLLNERRGQASRAFVEHLCTYALGRSLNFSDRPHVDTIVAEFEKADYRAADLIKIIIGSELFKQ